MLVVIRTGQISDKPGTLSNNVSCKVKLPLVSLLSSFCLCSKGTEILNLFYEGVWSFTYIV